MIKNKTDENQTEFGYIVIRQPLKASFPRYPVGSAISSSGLDKHKIIIIAFQNRIEEKRIDGLPLKVILIQDGFSS